MGFDAAVLALVISICAAAPSIPSSEAQSFGFQCNSTGAVCNGLVGYVSPNATTLSQIETLFGIKNLRNILGANNFPLATTPSNQSVAASQIVNIPFQCLCNNGSGVSRNRRPIYKVVPGDFLYHIAAEVFSGLVTYQQIQAANGIANVSLIEIGQKLWIPLPCSCDPFDGERVVHYGHVVQPGSTVAQIAQQYNTSADVLISLNNGSISKGLQAGAVLDVPLKACTSQVRINSWDYPLLVANGTYAFTSGNCVKCSCDAANNWTLQCEPSLVKSNLWTTCPSMQCQGAESLIIGNTTSSGCKRSTCAYAGYDNKSIFTTLSTESTCPSPANNAPKVILQGWSWTFLLMSFHLVVLSLHFIK